MQRQMVNVYLGGRLGQRFGKEWRLNVASPAEAIRAIDVNTKGKLKEYLYNEGRNKYYKVALGEKDKLLGAEELGHKSGSGDIYIMPAVKGQGSGLTKVLLGVVLIAAVIFAPELGALYGSIAGVDVDVASAYASAAFGFGTIGGGIIASLGTSLLLGGISQLLAPHANGGGSLGSNYFQGNVVAGLQGGCVPVVYGKALVAPITISVWFNNVDYSTTQNTYVGFSNVVNLPGGGGYEYTPGSLTAIVGSASGT